MPIFFPALAWLNLKQYKQFTILQNLFSSSRARPSFYCRAVKFSLPGSISTSHIETVRLSREITLFVVLIYCRLNTKLKLKSYQAAWKKTFLFTINLNNLGQENFLLNCQGNTCWCWILDFIMQTIFIY